MPGKVKNQIIDPKEWDTARMINIGFVAKTYGLLPSEVVARATTFDLMITDVMTSWEKHQMDKATQKVSPESYSQDQLQEILEKSRGG